MPKNHLGWFYDGRYTINTTYISNLLNGKQHWVYTLRNTRAFLCESYWAWKWMCIVLYCPKLKINRTRKDPWYILNLTISSIRTHFRTAIGTHYDVNLIWRLFDAERITWITTVSFSIWLFGTNTDKILLKINKSHSGKYIQTSTCKMLDTSPSPKCVGKHFTL